MTEILIDAGINVNKMDRYGHTPLFYLNKGCYNCGSQFSDPEGYKKCLEKAKIMKNLIIEAGGELY